MAAKPLRKQDSKSKRKALANNRLIAYEMAEEPWRFILWNYAYMASGGKWLPFPALKYIANIIQREIVKGGARIIINIPPRHGKSELLSHWLPTWFLDFFSDKNVLLTSYGVDLAGSFGKAVRDELKTNNKTWGEVKKDDEGATSWRTTEGGGMKTAGVGGPVLGRGGDLVIIDDPHKNFAEAMSPVKRKAVINWFKSTLYTRLEPDANVILIMQRWHEEDLSGYLQNKSEEKWMTIRLPAIADSENDPLGRRLGAALIPQRYDEYALKAIRRTVGPVIWAGLYQQLPGPEEGNIILEDWIQYYLCLPPNINEVVVSWDMSFKKTGKSFCVGQVWAPINARHYLLHQERGHWDFTTALKKVVALHNYSSERWGHVKETLIEEAANGHAIISTVKGRLPRVKKVKASVSKIERLSNAAPSVEDGDVFLPDESIAPWVNDLVYELKTFPNAENDDQCDALSQYINEYKVDKVGDMILNLSIGVNAEPIPFQ